MSQSLTVGGLRVQLSGLAEDLPVYIQMFSEETDYQNETPDDMHYVRRAEHAEKTSISNEHFSIVAGIGFGWWGAVLHPVGSLDVQQKEQEIEINFTGGRLGEPRRNSTCLSPFRHV